MTSASAPDHGTDPASTDRLAAESAAADYWRAVATDRRVEAARVQRRPMVRAAVALDRRTRPLQDRAAGMLRTVRAAGDRLRARATPGLGPAPAARPASGADPSDDVLIVRMAAHGATDPDPAVAASDAAVVVLLGPGIEAEGDAIGALVDALDDPAVVAALPCSRFSGPGAGGRTAHAGEVRSAGARAALVDDAPVAEVLAAPTGIDVVDLSAGRAIAVRRDDWCRAGGLEPTDDLEADLVDLGLRLVALDNRRVVVVPDAWVIDGAEPVRPVELRQRPAADRPGWARVVDRHGPTLRRLAVAGGHPVRAADSWSAMVTTATPSPKIASHSGDWHFAGCLVDALGRTGVDARRQTIADAESTAGRSRDVHLVLRGLEPVRRSPGQVHVIWVISHPEALTAAECDEADLVLVASPRYAAHLRDLTSTPVEVFLQATDANRFRPEAARQTRSGVTIVANTRGVRRASVDAALAAGHRPRIHGLGWDGLVDPDLVASTYVSFEDLPAVYASSAVVLNDHWETMRLWGFASNRILDATAAGATVVSDHMPEVTDLFGDLVPTWRTADELGAILDRIASDPDAARERAASAREIVLAGHTFDHRVTEIDDLLRRHGLHPAP